MLLDNHGREINYLRLAVTDRCNLRCFYCMPMQGIRYVDRKELLSFEEMLRITGILAAQGISKVRITGGEPFVRKGLMGFLEKLAAQPGIRQVHITTNGTHLSDHLERLKELGIASVNLSLDSLDASRFREITRSDTFTQVMDSFEKLMLHGIKTKVNMVVMNGKNIEDIYPMIELTRNQPVEVRFIEEMPFNGTSGQGNTRFWPYKEIISYIENQYPLTKQTDLPGSTSQTYKIEGHKGSVGIIPAYTRTFCGTCNRLRITPQGIVKTCLYDSGSFNIKDIIRQGESDEALLNKLKEALGNRAKNGHEAEQRRIQNSPVSESMATIGG